MIVCKIPAIRDFCFYSVNPKAVAEMVVLYVILNGWNNQNCFYLGLVWPLIECHAQGIMAFIRALI